ncbi:MULTISPECIES: hypothetical protein [unclassified Pseudomonas]|uniref:hypothetical protein n=1 Tax=unclassified Pseudomonas TaxID=196821 RepID=UPI0015B48046|nr:hypothetical protein [Pseudomonas sp. RGB]
MVVAAPAKAQRLSLATLGFERYRRHRRNRAEAGFAAGTLNTARQIGAALGVAPAGTLL